MNEHQHPRLIDELLDRAVQAINSGDRATADALAEQVLAVDRSNPDAEELLGAPADSGEIRRLTILFADLVDSTALSTRIEPEVYRTVVGRFRDQVQRIVDHYEGYIDSVKGDGLMAVFGHPHAHENDGRRAVQAGLDVSREVAALSQRVRQRFGFDIGVRVGVHHGVVYLDTANNEVYGLGANLAARMCGLAEPGTVVVSEGIERLVRDAFELEGLPAKPVKGVEGEVVHYRVIGEREIGQISSGATVGRHDELAYLEMCWAHARDGTLALPGVIFKGEAGIGKSHLAGTAVEMAERSNAVVLGLFGSPFHTDVGLRPVRRLIERSCGIDRNSDPTDRLRRLETEVAKRGLQPAAVIPLLAPVLGIAQQSGYEPAKAAGSKLFDQIAGAVHDYLLACLGDGPALVLIEDMHWFDEDTIEVVHSLLRENLGRVLVVITTRQLDSVPDGAREFELKPLSADEADELILALAPQLHPDSRTAVRRRCDGIPLYIEEVVAKLAEQPSDASESARVPDSLYEALFARLRSSEKAVLIVEAAAIIGGRFSRGLLRSAADVSDDDVDQVIEELNRSRVLVPVEETSWRFRHELLRELAAELSPPSLRRKIHGRIADALAFGATDGNPDWPLVASHYANAERFEDAASAYQQASDDARRRGALGEARTYLTRSLEQIERLDPGPARDRREVAVRMERGFLASAALGHSSTEVAAEFERCLQLIGTEPSHEMYATFSALWSYYSARGDLRRGTQLLTALKAARRGDAQSSFSPANESTLGFVATFRGELHRARSTFEKSAAMFEAEGALSMEAWYAPNDPYAGMYAFLALTRFLQGDLSGAETALTRSVARCEKLGYPHGPFSLCYGRCLDSWIRIEAGQLDLATGIIDEVIHRAEQDGFDEWVLVASSNRAVVRMLTALAEGATDADDLQEHVEALTAYVNTWRAYEMLSWVGFYDAELARVLVAAGKHDAARDHVDLALQTANQTEIHFYDTELLRHRAHTYADPEARHAELLAVIELARRQGAAVFELRAAADDFELVGDSARAALVDAANRFPPDQTWPDLARVRALLA